MVIIISGLIGVALLLALMAPFFLGPGGLLAHASRIDSSERLLAIREALLKRYLDDEAAFKGGDLSPTAWRKRQEFLVHRYVDVARRLDFLQGADQAKSATGGQT